MNDLQYYDEVLRELKHPQRQKIMRVIPYIRRVNAYTYHSLPIPGYNHSDRPHILILSPDGSWHCSCQGYASKLKRGLVPTCSHIEAAKLWLRRNGERCQAKLFQAAS